MFPYSRLIPPRLEMLLAEYGESHQNKLNILIHWIFEPLAIWAILAMFWSLPLPDAISQTMGVNGMVLLLIFMLAYFASLSLPITIVLAVIAAVFAGIVAVVANGISIAIWQLGAPIFVVSWIALFLGHKIEGNNPSVFKNPHLIFIGPIWLLTKTRLIQKKPETQEN